MGRRGKAKSRGEWITLQEAAEKLGINYRRALEMAQCNQIPGMAPHDPGTDYRFDKNDVLRFAAKRKRT